MESPRSPPRAPTGPAHAVPGSPARPPAAGAAEAVHPPGDASPGLPPDDWHRRTFASFALADYRWFYLGQGSSLVGSWVRSAAQGWLVYELTGSKLQLGVVAAASQLPLLLSPLAGTLADRADRRRLLMALALVAMTLSLTLAALTGTGVVQPWHIVLIAALAGTEMAVELPTRQSYVFELVGRRNLLNAIALNSAAFNLARMVGPALAGLLIGTFTASAATDDPDALHAAVLRGIGYCFLIDGLSYLGVLYALTRIRAAPAVRPHDAARWTERLAAGFAYVRGDRRTRVILLLVSVSVVFGWPYVTLLPAFAQDVLHLDALGYGLLMAANGLGACCGALWVAGRREAPTRRALRRRVFGSLWLFAGMVIVFSRIEHPVLAGCALSVAGFGAIAFVSTSNTLVQVAAPDALRGRVMGIWALVFGASMPLGSWLIGLLAEWTDAATAITLTGASCLGLSALVRLGLPPPVDAPPPPPDELRPDPGASATHV